MRYEINEPIIEPRLVTRIAIQKFHCPSATLNPTNGIAASLGTGAIMLSRHMRNPAPAYPVRPRISTARSEIFSVIMRIEPARVANGAGEAQRLFAARSAGLRTR